MSITTCTCCGSRVTWGWEEAFDKFGFDDGDGLVMTSTVVDALRENGYTVEVVRWGCHNEIITGISRNGASLIPVSATVGYDDPRSYLPEAIVALLDRIFPENAPVWVSQAFRLCCPNCGSDRQLQIAIQSWIDVGPDGNVLVEDTPHEWHPLGRCRCLACAHAGHVMDFEQPTTEVLP